MAMATEPGLNFLSEIVRYFTRERHAARPLASSFALPRETETTALALARLRNEGS